MACRYSSAIFVACLAILVVSAIAVTKEEMMGWMYMTPGAAPMPDKPTKEEMMGWMYMAPGAAPMPDMPMPWMNMGPAPTPDVSGSVIASFPSMAAVIVASIASAFLF